MSFEVTLWGVRGSLPTAYYPPVLEQRIVDICKAFGKSKFTDIESFLESIPAHLKGGYGGNTTCVEVNTSNTKIIIDAGTGIRHTIPNYMSSGCQNGKGVVHLFFTHFHWDHILGLPFFAPIYIPGNTIHIYAVQTDLENILKTLFQKPFFPVPYKALGAKIVYHQLIPREAYQLHDLTITPYQLDHPDPCWGYKITHKDKTYAHCVDTEALRVTREELSDDLALYQNVDLMVFDAQYSIAEAKEKLNWGHSSAPKGLEIAVREKIKKVVFVHHDPMATDEQTSKIAREAVKYFESYLEKQRKNGKAEIDVEWGIGYEGMVIKLLE